MKTKTPKTIKITNGKTRETEKHFVQVKQLIQDYNNTGKSKTITGIWYSHRTPLADVSAISMDNDKIYFGMIQDVAYISEETYQRDKEKYTEMCYLEDLDDLPEGHVLEQIRNAYV